jgi:hypothetical protein
MPHRRVPRLLTLARPLSVALALVAMLALAPSASPPAYAQAGPDGPMMGPGGGMGPMMGPGGQMGMGPGMGPRGGRGPAFGPGGGDWAAFQGPFGEITVMGQTQLCNASVGADTNWHGFYGPTVGEFVPSNYLSYTFPPYGGVWGFYTGAGNICLWRPT